ncbi:MAG: ABC transporter ATP-binding protein, partial [Actinomycetota bacterium]|nr:ABC transporter ATP-binding protein [Actinomycetota bacterium]
LGAVSRAGASGEGVVESSVTSLPGVVAATSNLKDALAQLLLNDAGWVVVVDDGGYCGVLTVETLHAAIRRSVV